MSPFYSLCVFVDIEVFRAVFHRSFYHRNYAKGTYSNCLLTEKKQQQKKPQSQN